MADDLQEKILQATIKLFSQHGPEKVTMRDIASECGISVGNLTYHYHKKESLFSAVYKEMLKRTLNRYRECVSVDEGEENPWVTYVAINYAHLHTVAHDENGISAYVYSMRFPMAREAYVSANNELLINCLGEKAHTLGLQKLWVACMVGCGGEFEAMQAYMGRKNEYGFDQLIIPTITARLYVAGIDHSEIEPTVSLGVQAGRDLLSSNETFSYLIEHS